MAKGQKRSNREIKKPKQVKTPVAPQALTSRLTESKDRPAKQKK
jgi:hypothetical protein